MATASARPTAEPQVDHHRLADRLSLALLWIQGSYYLLTGIWPLVSIRTFQLVTGPKTDHLPTGREADHWLVMTAGALITSISLPLVISAWRGRVRAEVIVLAIAAAVGLTCIDVIYVIRDVIAPIYLLDAAIQVPLILAWLVAIAVSRSGWSPARPKEKPRGMPVRRSKDEPPPEANSSALHRLNWVLEKLSRRVTEWVGSSWAFALAASVVAIWALTGPLFGFSETWQLIINTSTTIVTFLMVFLIQRSQNKESLAVEVKLNELLAAQQGASNELINAEDMSEEEIRKLHKDFSALARNLQEAADECSPHSITEAHRAFRRMHQSLASRQTLSESKAEQAGGKSERHNGRRKKAR